MQRLWKQNLNWDDNLPWNLQQDWELIYNSLERLNEIQIDRLVMIKNPVHIQFHGFSDASEAAYGACVYFRSCNSDGNVVVNLLCAKSRLAPLKQVSLPRLELYGAVLLTRLIARVKASIDLNINETYLWTDSSILLAWLKGSPSIWKTFVANRVSEVQDLTKECTWHHVSSASNPADMVSRGVTPQKLITNELWWHGPSWLTETPSQWPSLTFAATLISNIPEMRPTVSFVASTCSDDILKESSSLPRVQRKNSYCLRFIKNCKGSKNSRNFGPLSTKELKISLNTCIKLAHRVCYSQELTNLKSGRELATKSTIRDYL
ncbi:uncharacterized protein LOC142317482 [Lycorma delicatula]|uniref:uncharacterized protein LOC142317482 n=1 Tax=Lycorma delicatula TaxID=130591 RepID=UPI003F50F9C2